MKYKTYLFTYSHSGSDWVLEIQAPTREDAEARLAKIANATYDGELVMKIPTQLGLIPRFAATVRNVLKKILLPFGT